MKKLFLLTIVALGFTAVSFGQGASATANVTGSHSISSGTALSFGSFSITGAGSIVIKSDGTVESNTGCTSPTAGTFTASVFTVYGQTGESFWVTYPGIVTINKGLGGPNKQMTVDTWTSNVGTSNLDAALLTTNAAFLLKVGGKLTFLGTEETGGYTGDYSITANFQ